MSRRVLIVDDHQRFRETARRALEADGWTVVGEAVDGAGALREVKALDADVVLLDVGLPDIHGSRSPAACGSTIPGSRWW